jgi:hypothetical protein
MKGDDDAAIAIDRATAFNDKSLWPDNLFA